MGLTRILELIFFIYFLTHIPITILIDSQAVFPKWLYPEQLVDILQWYGEEFRDPMMLTPPAWFKSFCVCEVLLQFPFFFVATYAFWKGRCRWIRIPAIIYSSHVATTLVAIFGHIACSDFVGGIQKGPETFEQKLKLMSIYMPFLIFPLLILVTMVFSREYKPLPPSRSKGSKKQR